jgi:hypothetical protein
MKNKKLTASDMGKLSHKKARERMGEEKYREMQLKKSLQAKIARALKKSYPHPTIVEETVDSKI